jgi:hypothetical protein
MFTIAAAADSVIDTNPQKLKEIGPNPSDPKALGDLLMRWVIDFIYFYQVGNLHDSD